MNKLVYVNISGVVFQIDESAYQTLDRYLNSIRKKYASTAGGDEIVNDIENRIAELFHEKVGDRGAITSAYVQDIITLMGTPDAIGGDQFSENPITEQERSANRATRFYRDKENNLLGGVCAGFAAKFDVDVLWIRLAFLLFFFVFGTGVLLYIILWIIMPEAKTSAEKIEMRGEKVNIDTIEKTVRDGAGQLKKKANVLGEELKETFSAERLENTKRNAGDFIESAAATIKPAVKALVRIFAACIALICIIILVGIGTALLSDAGQINNQIQFLSRHVIGDGKMSWVLIVSALALVIIPLTGLLFSVSKFLLGIKKRFRPITITLVVLWIAALTAVIISGIKIGLNFREDAEVSSSIPLHQPSQNVQYVTMTPLPIEQHIKHKHYKGNWNEMIIANDTAYFKDIRIELQQSTDSNYAVIMTKYAKGNTHEEAKARAKDFAFSVSQNDSVLLIPGGRALLEDELWRNQHITITLRIPQNKCVLLDSNLDNYLDRNSMSKGLTDDVLLGQILMMTAGGLVKVN